MWLVQIILIVLVITTNNLAMAKAKQDTPKNKLCKRAKWY
jgi:hypothetical protein